MTLQFFGEECDERFSLGQTDSNGPIRTVNGPVRAIYAPDSDRHEIEYVLPFPFHAVDPNLWQPLRFVSDGVPITIYRPLHVLETHSTRAQIGNEQADAYCTIVRLSVPITSELEPYTGWKIIKRLMEWIRVKCRHYWLLHGINGFGASYRGTRISRKGAQLSQQNIALYGPNVIVNPMTVELWNSMLFEMSVGSEVPLADSIFCDALLSIVAGDNMKALLEAGVAMEIAITQLLVDVAASEPITPAKNSFMKKEGDWDSFSKKLSAWTRKLDLTKIEDFSLESMDAGWSATVRDLYKLRNGVAHGGRVAFAPADVVKNMFAAGALLEYCRSERIRLGLSTFAMPDKSSPWQQIRFCHDACMDIQSNVVDFNLQP